MNTHGKKTSGLTVREMTVFSMLGAIMFLSKLLMEALPNIHLLGVLTMAYTLAYRGKALFPLYLNVLLVGIYGGFNLWWLPYVYIWTILWGVTMLLPKKMSRGAAAIVYPAVCALHGLCYGTLYAPAQALMFGLDFRQTLAWIAAGLPWDVLHGAGNLLLGFIILPLSELLRRLSRGTRK